MPPRALVAFIAVALVPLGAGDDEDDLRAVVAGYLRVAPEGNGRQACAFYAAGAATGATRQARKRHVRSCAALLGTRVRYQLASLPGDLRRDLEHAIAEREQIGVELRGENATRATFATPHSAMADVEATLTARPTAGGSPAWPADAGPRGTEPREVIEISRPSRCALDRVQVIQPADLQRNPVELCCGRLRSELRGGGVGDAGDPGGRAPAAPPLRGVPPRVPMRAGAASRPRMRRPGRAQTSTTTGSTIGRRLRRL